MLSSIRTVIAFGGEEKEIERYDKNLSLARRAGCMRGLLVAVGAGVMWFIIYGSYALAFWCGDKIINISIHTHLHICRYGVKLIMDDREVCVEDPENCVARYTPASLLIVSCCKRHYWRCYCSVLGFLFRVDGSHERGSSQPLH